MGYTYYDTSRRSEITAMYSSMDSHTFTKTVFTQTTVGKMHDSMNPKGIAFRECRDSETHPNTLPIIISLDVTGSMREIPKQLMKSGLPKLVGNLIQKGIKDPSILFTAVGDHNYDDAPLQVGQFESGDAEMDLWLSRTWLEGGGGANFGESYLLSWYFAARYTKLDSFEKRNSKGFLFTIGDEPSLGELPKNALRNIMGNSAIVDGELTDISLLKEAEKMYNVYHIHVLQGSAGEDSKDYWQNLLGQKCILVKDYEDIPNVISEIIINNKVISTVIENTDQSKEQEIL